MNATFSFVPTPSALDTSTGSSQPPRLERNRPPNDPISESTPGVKVPRASRLDAADGLVAGVDVDAGRLVVWCRSCHRLGGLGAAPVWLSSFSASCR